MPIDTIITVGVIMLFVISIILHEVAHGAVAYSLGDDTAYLKGRLTLNPIKHIDPIWTIVMPLIMFKTIGVAFGGAKPVPVNPMRFRNPRKGMMWVALAGPVTNLTIAIVLAGVLFLAKLVASGGVMTEINMNVLSNAILINLFLALFNMIPVPPLDGSRVLAGLVDQKTAISIYRFERYGMMVLIGLIMLPNLTNDAIDPLGSIAKLAFLGARLLGAPFK